MQKVLAVSATEKSAMNLCNLVFKATGLISPSPCTSASKARRVILDEYWDLVMVNLPLSDEDGVSLIRMISEETDYGIIALVKEDDFPAFSETLSGTGALIVTKPILVPMLNQAINMIDGISERIAKLKDENRKLEAKLEEIKIISRAKCLLISKKGVSEEEAHHMIERRAMNSRISLKEAAVTVIRLYSN